MSIKELRAYRINLEDPSSPEGVAIFDVVGSFAVAWLLYKYTRIQTYVSKTTYYLSVLPAGVLTHALIGQKTFLNDKLFNLEINIYKFLGILTIFFMVKYKK